MSHERSITVQADGRWVNLKTVFNKKQLSGEQVMKMFREGRLKPLGGKTFGSMREAVNAAKKRSSSFNRGEAMKKALE